VWGAAATLAGGLLSITTGHAMGKLFSSGIIGGNPTRAFALAVLVGTTAWVTLASIVRLPVSTTHALVGSLIGTGLLFASDEVHWHGLVVKVAVPLLASIALAYGASLLISIVVQSRSRRARRRPADSADPESSGGTAARSEIGTDMTATALLTRTETEQQTKTSTDRGQRAVTAVHWLSAGAASAARGLNDTPKIAAVGAFALVPAGLTLSEVALIVALAMCLGSLLGIRVARTLGERVVKMSHTDGLRANLVTAALVGAGATLGWPMSTTHVSTGSIAGTAGRQFDRLNRKVLRDFVIAWTITPIFAALVAALVYVIVR